MAKAELRELEGKYYGTEIVVTTDDGKEYLITIWDNEMPWEPSDRWLAEYGDCTIEQWRNNVTLPVRDPFTGEIGVEAREHVFICDSHFECRRSHELALTLVDLINRDRIELRIKGGIIK